MEGTIKSLIEFDEVGRTLVEEAQATSRELLAQMDDCKQELARRYEERMRSRVVLYREHAEAEITETLAAARVASQAQSDHLRETYRANRERWVSEMTARCIGG